MCYHLMPPCCPPVVPSPATIPREAMLWGHFPDDTRKVHRVLFVAVTSVSVVGQEGQPGSPLSISAPQEAAHKRMMCRRQACEAQTPELLRRHRSLMAHSLLPLAEKQRRVLRNLRRLEGLGLVSASDGYQGLVDELAKVTTLCACYVHAQVHLCTCTGGVTVLAFQGQALFSLVSATRNCHQPKES